MKVYKNLIIGSSFSSIGFAHASEETLIVEKTEMLDTSFYLPQRGFGKHPYTPLTESGKELDAIFRERGILSDKGQNVSAFEIGLSRFAQLHEINVYLKCRILDCREENGGFTVTLLHNGGVEDIFVKAITDTRVKNPSEKHLAIIFDCPEADLRHDLIEEAFPGAIVENSFYDGRYVLYAPIGEEDINCAKVEIYKRWQKLEGYRILYIASAFLYTGGEYPSLCDERYENPIEAFEAGIKAAEEVLI